MIVCELASMGGTIPSRARVNLSITCSFHEEKTGFLTGPSAWAVDVLSRLPFSAAQQRNEFEGF